jgi:hypothetical protein
MMPEHRVATFPFLDRRSDIKQVAARNWMLLMDRDGVDVARIIATTTSERGIPMSLRSFCRIAVAVFAFGAITVCSAQQNQFAGQWSGKINGVTITYVMDANSNYTDRVVSGSLQTMEQGKYRVAQNVIVFEVQDWAPKTQNVYHATGISSGYYSQQPMAKPPGGSFSFVFNSPNSVTLTDLTAHGSITLNRVP